MKKKLNEVLLIDDDEDCNFYHQLLLKKMECAENVRIALNGKEAMDYLTTKQKGDLPKPAMILLDINMPVMDGWDFMKEYEQLSEAQRNDITLIMLTTSLNPDDHEKAKKIELVDDIKNKYLTESLVNELIEAHFPDYL